MVADDNTEVVFGGDGGGDVVSPHLALSQRWLWPLIDAAKKLFLAGW